jgi:hypothetical protein
MTTTPAPGKVIVSSVLDEDDRDKLVRLARHADRSLSAEIRRAVGAYLTNDTTTTEEQPSAIP